MSNENVVDFANAISMLPKSEDESYIVPSGDTQGHSAPVGFRTQPGHVRQMHEILASRKFPYRTPSDLYRHALLRHLKWLETREAVPSVIAQVDVIISIVRDAEFQLEFGKTMESVAVTISKCISEGHLYEAHDMLQAVKQAIEGMPFGRWKASYEQEFEKRFGGLLNGQSSSP